MKTNEIKKGMRVKLRNTWEGTMMDNAKGDRRMVDVEGFCREIGSVYSHDIVFVRVGAEWVQVAHTEKQRKLRDQVAAPAPWPL